MGETHINIWRENVEEGIELAFAQKGICQQNGKPRYEFEFKMKSGVVVSFWTCDPLQLRDLMLDAALAINRVYQDETEKRIDTVGL